ncbi:hypothetical protein [cyanobacterium endosymbiont of Rhopalodia gibberula]|nr:hypothetical protein [cyanobacterium endosymbiont of Rhopalodia gibberula]
MSLDDTFDVKDRLSSLPCSTGHYTELCFYKLASFIHGAALSLGMIGLE